MSAADVRFEITKLKLDPKEEPDKDLLDILTKFCSYRKALVSDEVNPGPAGNTGAT